MDRLWTIFGEDDSPSPPMKYASFVGILVAIAGNVIISFALNCQKLAHRQLEAQRNGTSSSSSSTPTPEDAERGRRTPTQQSTTTTESQPLLRRDHSSRSYASTNSSSGALHIEVQAPTPLGSPPVFSSGTPRSPIRLKSGARLTNASGTIVGAGAEDTILEELQDDAEVRFVQGERVVSWVDGAPAKQIDEPNGNGNGNGGRFQSDETEYLKSKLWWLGFGLLNLGELGNFLSYAFAPASVVAPLGTFALVANCFFAPLMLKERFRKRDLLGIVIAIIGAVTVVIASKSSDVRLDPAGLLQAIKQVPFIVYASLSVAAALVLGVLSERSIGHDFVYIDVGLCAIFGGFTVLATKGISTLISLEGLNIFREPITYPLILVLAGTGVGQVKYLNRALMSFDSKVVVPTQFVLFTLAAIIGSAILYRDFDNISYYRFVVFVYGCATTFLGTFVLTRPDIQLAPPSTSAADEEVPFTPRTMRIPAGTPILRSRKSSRASLVLSPAYLLLATSPPGGSGGGGGHGGGHGGVPIPRTRARSRSADPEAGAGVSPATTSSVRSTAYTVRGGGSTLRM